MKKMTPSNDDYGGFRDFGFMQFLEDLVIQHRSCEIVFRSEGGGRAVIRDRIGELEEAEGGAVLWTDGGLRIRVEQLIQVDGRTPSNFC